MIRFVTVRRFFVLAALLLASLPSLALAQNKERGLMQEGLDLYQKGEYAEALHKFQDIKEGLILLDAPEQVTVHKYRAYCLIVMERVPEAKKEFKAALDVDPSFALDPASTPPKILSVFNEVKVAETPAGPGHAAKLSALAPGLGQWQTKRRTAAYVSGGLVVASIGALVVTQMNASAADSYVSKAGPLEKTKMKNQAQSYDLMRDGAAVLLVGAWVGGVWDAYRGANRIAHTPTQGAPVASIHVVPAAAPGGAGILLTGEF